MTFDIDANGILKVSAKDQGTGQEKNITINNSSGLDSDEIEKMKSEAEANAESDQAKRDLVDAKNQGEGFVYEVEKQVKEHGDKLDEAETKAIEDAKTELKTALETDDIAAIQAKTEALQKASYKLAEKIYGQAGEAGAGAEGGPDMPPPGTEAPSGGSDNEKDEKIIDADFEVKS